METEEPQPSPPARARDRLEVLYETERTRVSRISRGDVVGSLIRKESLGPGAVERRRHERRIIERLAGVAGVVRLAAQCGPDELMLDDIGGDTLATHIRVEPPDINTYLGLALELAGIVGAIHRAGVVHKDINPANILVSSHRGVPVLIDFELASTFGEDRPTFAHHREVLGTLPYLAPEQTGRTGMSVDERADLYALGATLYQLATGEPPFRIGDPLQMVHDALSRVPIPPATLDARVPIQFSDIVMRLLEKEPDRRYQSADGLAHDLTRLVEDLAAGRQEPFALGGRDFPARLSAPSRLVGRESEIGALQKALDSALAGGSRGFLVAGASGVGKTALISTLRSAVTERGGWYVTGKFDQHRQDTESGAIRQALRSLGHLLLADTEAEVAAARARIAEVLGSRIGLVGSILPEFAVLLEVPQADPVRVSDGEAGVVAARLKQAALDLLGVVASPDRPVVVVLDDLQWASAMAVSFIDAVLTDETLTNVLLVGSYRSGEVEATHPLATAISRWEQLEVPPPVLRLENLPPASVSELLAGMLRLTSDEANGLADVVGARTGGNPYDTVELVNALRRGGVLVAGPTGWSWDAATIRHFVGQCDVADLLGARLGQLPASSRELLEIMACLGGVVGLDLLQAASGRDTAVVTEQLLAPLDDGLLVLELGDEPAVLFRHDRVQRSAFDRLGSTQKVELHLSLARRLAAAPGHGAVAAVQYLASVEEVLDRDERRLMAGLFVASAQTTRLVEPGAAERLLSAAILILDTGEAATDDPLLAAAERMLHAVLFSLGRLADADPLYARIQTRTNDPMELVEATCVQISSLFSRGEIRSALVLGMALLERLGMDLPKGDFAPQLERGCEELAEWASGLVLVEDLRRPDTVDRWVRLKATLINRLQPVAFCSDQSIFTWLTLTSKQLWDIHGPCAPLVANLSGAGQLMMLRGDYRTGYFIGRHVLAVGEARGYEPATSFARHVLSFSADHWCRPLEGDISQSQQAREGLVRGGELTAGGGTYLTSLAALIDSSPSLDSCAEDLDRAVAFSARTGNTFANGVQLTYRQLIRAFRGQTSSPGSFCDDSFDEARHLAALGRNPMAITNFHIYRALSAALFGDTQSLTSHAAAAMPLLPGIVGFYSVALAHLLQGMALAERVRVSADGEHPALLAELDACRDWLTARAAEAPANFTHLATLLTAERSWAVGDDWGCLRAFDTASREVARQCRPWHQALITERAAAFHNARGLDKVGRDLLREARGHYLAWCAPGKVRQLDEAHPFLRTGVARQTSSSVTRFPSAHESSVSLDEIDMLAILAASQALSAETSLERLRTRLGELLQAMTGATTVLIVLRHDSADDWQVWDTTGGRAGGLLVPEAAEAGVLSVSAFRYVERTCEPLVVEDATRDDRFKNDSSLTAVERCSMMMVPILSQGVVRAVLVLENRLRMGAFAGDRLDAVMLVTGQLAVSLDNAQLYDSLERKVADRTAALEAANLKLEVLSNTDALTGLPNRRHFDTTIEAELRRAVRQGTPLAIAMIDVDNFKLYNDHYGHLAGDECLRAVAAALQVGLRSEPDVICRYGGEEFAAILPGADETTGLDVAERVRAAVASLRQPHAVTAIGIVTISIGITAYVPGETTTAEQLLATADIGLYEAKENGRNSVRSARHHLVDSA